MQLTEQQQQIVAHNHGPAMVFAVAGAGKTTAMVHRVERLVRERVFAPDRILVSSFSKAAVDDLGEALATWPHCRRVIRRTLHGLGLKIVNDAAESGVLPPLAQNALKMNGEERQILWTARDRARTTQVIPADALDALDEQDFLDYLGACKGNLCYPDLATSGLPEEAMTVASQAIAPPGMPWYRDLYRLHEEVRRERGWLTFDDMLMLSWEALMRSPALCTRWQQRFDAVIVDEFQDVNLAQAEILDRLTKVHRNYMAIGDDDQTIYGFRGASMSFFREFEQRYGAVVYTITENFRCQASQILLANSVITQNRDRYPKQLVITQGFAGCTLLRRSLDVQAMGQQVVADIAAALRQGYTYPQIAILVRLTAQTPTVEQALIEAGIPYRIAGDEPFFARREVADLLKYAELAAGDAQLRRGQPLVGEEAERVAACWRALYNRPRRYLSRQLANEVLALATSRHVPLSDALVELMPRVHDRLAVKLQELADLLVWFGDMRATLPADQLLLELDRRLDYQAFLREQSGSAETGAGRAGNVAAFLQYAAGKGNLDQLLQHLEELAAERLLAQRDAPSDGVDIRTIHRSKGLEWPVVLLPNCNAGYLPCGGSDDIDEERRLLYVAITRARRDLYLYAVNGGDAQLSPFLLAADVDTVLEWGTVIGALLASDPSTWTAVAAVRMLTFPRQYGQERFFTHWWKIEPTLRIRFLARVLGLLALLRDQQLTERHNITPADEAFWRTLADDKLALDLAPFPDFARLFPEPALVQPDERVRSPADPPDYRIGEAVRHPHFGPGTVVAIDQRRTRRTVEWHITVEFRSRGFVKLLASIAPLEKVS